MIFKEIKQNDLKEMVPTSPEAVEIQQVLKNREGDLSILAPFVISEEKKISQTVNHKYNFIHNYHHRFILLPTKHK